METGNDYLERVKKELISYQEKEKKKSSRSGLTGEQRLAKYFIPRNESEIFRILPPLPNQKPIQEAFFHVVPVKISGGKIKHGEKIYCPAHNDPMIPKLDSEGNEITDQNGKPMLVPKPCPLCEKAKEILKTQDSSISGKKKEELSDAEKKIWEKNREIFIEANKWEAKKFYIIRGIDKGKEKDGVKFWRFKKNFKNQGVLDKLLPALNQFMEIYKKPFFDPDEGADIVITMAESEFNKKTYMAVSAIITRPPSKLHNDPIIVKQWLSDKVTWRDVFKPKTAPNITPYEYLQMVAEGNNPYWDDIDQNNKHWVFPNRPDLEEKANSRFKNLDADDDDYGNFEHASDIADDGVTIRNITKDDVGSFNDKSIPQAVDVMGDLDNNEDDDLKSNVINDTDENNKDLELNDNDFDDDEYGDLPF